ncbi:MULTISPECIES: VanZ family protein [Brevibacterium]|nr:VanZ family protein [Brevibacterium casei]MCT2182078.1 VanZ family protein [Brevibacterium casei]MCT2357963.1 VanZ family protein [Brevibacterium casei]MDH5147854.1 VanZ family protein [Brevibacterium casei]SIG52496.1 Predicted integral membrane protein [Mycobacteroides abscessus subsp. abscessus]
MRGYRQRVRTVPMGLLILYTAFIALITLTPQQLDTSPGSPIARLLAFFASHEATEWLSYERVEMLANVGLFVPFGFLLAFQLGVRRWWIGWVAGAAFTCLIEATQLTLLSPTRFGTISDLVTNTLGAGLGAALALLVMLLLPKRVEREPAEFAVR